jgi:hypothetical protein
VVDFCEHGNEPSDFIKMEFLDHLSNCQFFKGRSSNFSVKSHEISFQSSERTSVVLAV